jgi:hypothetical protein
VAEVLGLLEAIGDAGGDVHQKLGSRFRPTLITAQHASPAKYEDPEKGPLALMK